MPVSEFKRTLNGNLKEEELEELQETRKTKKWIICPFQISVRPYHIQLNTPTQLSITLKGMLISTDGHSSNLINCRKKKKPHFR